MSRRGRGREAAISLFSFQDIITSVTAIMILLVLILSLELVTRVPGRQVSAEDRRTAADLRRSLDEVRQRVAAIRHAAGDAREEALAIAGFDAEETRARTAAAGRQRDAGRSEIRSLASRLSETRSLQREAERSLSRSQSRDTIPQAGEIEALEVRTVEIEAANREEERRQEEERRRLASQPRRSSRLVFNAAPEDGRSPVLLDVSQRGLVGLDPADGSLVRLGAFRFGPPGALGRWLAGLDQDSQYVVVLLRPSGVDSYDAVRDAVVEAGLGIGLELIGEAIEVAVNDPGRAG